MPDPMQPTRQFVVAFDFDGCLAQYEGGATDQGPPPMLGPHPGIPALLNKLHQEGYLIVVWTCRNQPAEIESWGVRNGVHIDAINENPLFPQARSPLYSPKIYADIYVDDRGLHYAGGPVGGLYAEITRRRDAWLVGKAHKDQ